MDKKTTDLRIDKLRSGLRQKGIDGIIITKTENVHYFSGFTGSECRLIITDKRALFISDFRYTEQANKECPSFEVVEYSGSLIDELKRHIDENDIKVLAFEEYNVNYSTFEQFRDNFGVNQLVKTGDIVENLRIIKDEYEIGQIKNAVNIADSAFTHILDFIKPGVSELDIALELEFFMKKNGAQKNSFDSIVASGPRSSLPHGQPTERKFVPGDAITMDFGALYNNYCSDMTRTVFLGKPSDELKKIYDIVLEAQLKSEEAAIAGKTGKEVDAVARDIIAANGFGKNFGHGLGHGVGLEIHEAPRLSFSSDMLLQAGMVVTIEPGIYVAGSGGVRIEDTIVITGEKPFVLTGSTKEMIVL